VLASEANAGYTPWGNAGIATGKTTKEEKMKNGVLRVGGIGTGRIFQYAHIGGYPRFFERARLVGFYDLNKIRAQQALDKYAVLLDELAENHPEWKKEISENRSELRCHDSLDSLLEQVDAVDICTHARGRMPSAIAAFKKNVSAMSEKPMARTWTETDRAARTLAEHEGNGVRFQLNDDEAFSLQKRVIHDVIASGAIGNVQAMSMVRGSRLDGKTVLQAQANAMENGGGCMMDYGTHGLAGVFQMLGRSYKAVAVEAVQIATLFPHRVLENEPYRVEVDDNARFKVLMRHEESGSWVTIFIEATWCGAHLSFLKDPDRKRSFLQIVGDKGIIDTEPNLIIVKHWDGGVVEIPLRQGVAGERLTHVEMYRTFFDAVQKEGKIDLDIHYGSDVIAICGAAYLSALQGTAVTLEDYMSFCQEFIDKYGDNEKADDAIVTELLKPYRMKS
jgi:predicted dehydrogenase